MTDAAVSTFVYVTYIRTTPEQLWAALTRPEFTRQYWFGIEQETDWQVGSPWQIRFADGRIADTGEIVEADPPRRLSIKWRNEFRPELKAEGFSRCTMVLEPTGGAVKLTVTHVMERSGSKFIEAVSGGWPQILSNLKSLLDTGELAVAEHDPDASQRK
ncbi:MAG: SRPBCC family protein [Paraburkholderia sp.]